MKNLAVILFAIFCLTVNNQAQQTPEVNSRVVTQLFSRTSSAVVKGAPYSAEAISESVQTLADGNRIVRSNTTKLFRDSEGRVRREGDAANGNGFSYAFSGSFAGFGAQDTISIFDPVSNVNYFINPNSKTVRKSISAPTATGSGLILNGQTFPSLGTQIDSEKLKNLPPLPSLSPAQSGYFEVITTGNGAAVKENPVTRESLGTRDFDGVTADGTRAVTTIPAGAVGNERPIEIVYERWYSKDLQMIVYSKNTDPRFGEQTYRLINLSREEPDHSLFVPPADYKVVNNSVFTFTAPKPK